MGRGRRNEGTKERISVETDAGEAVRKRRNVEMDASGQGSDLTFFRLLPSLRVGNYLPFGGRQRSPIRGSLHPQLLRKRSVAASPDLSAAKKRGGRFRFYRCEFRSQDDETFLAFFHHFQPKAF